MSEQTPQTVSARCACGASLRMPAESAGMSVRCPKCRQLLTVPTPAPEARSTTGASPTPGARSTVDAPRRGRPRLALAELEKCYMCRAAMPPGATRCGRCGYDRRTKSYVTEEELRESAGWSRTPDEGSGHRTFWNDALLTVVCFADANNLIVLGVVSVIAIVGVFAEIGAGCAGFIVYGWLAGYYISVLEHAAGGEEELPPLTLTEGWIDGIIRPAIQFALSWIVVLAPALVCGIYTGVDASALLDSALAGSFAPSVVLTAVLLVLGTFCWPAAIMLMATWSAFDVIRVDRWVQIIGRTLPAYLAMWLMLLAVMAAQIAVSVVAGSGLAAIGRTGLTVSLVGAVGTTVGWVMTMRIIGLFYFHHRRLFPWENV